MSDLDFDLIELSAQAESLPIRYLAWAKNPKRDPAECRELLNSYFEAFDRLQEFHTQKKALGGGPLALLEDPSYMAVTSGIARALCRAATIAKRYRNLFIQDVLDVLDGLPEPVGADLKYGWLRLIAFYCGHNRYGRKR